MTSKNPAYPTAPPTSPGGMSEAALVIELVEVHGFTRANAKSLSWPQKIQVVIENRKAREAEFCAEDGDHDMLCVLPEPTPDDMFDMLDDEDEPDGVVVTELLEMAEDTSLIKQAALRTERGDFSDTEMVVAEYADEDDPAGVYMSQPEDEEIISLPVEDFEDDDVLDPEVMFAQIVQARAEHDATQPPPVFLGVPGVKDYVFDGHAGAGPSGAERWMNCTMSLTLSREFLETLSPNQQRLYAGANTAARQGTTAHSAAEAEANLILGRATQAEVDFTLLELSVLPEDEGEAYDEEMGEYITEYTDLIKSYAQERGDDAVMIEARVEAAIPLTDLHEGEVYVVRGSGDCVVLPTREEPTLVVGDLKYGNGLDVDVDENPQIRMYAIGVLELLADPETGEIPDWVKDVVYHIIQPRLGGIKTWTESIDDLLEWRDEVLAPALTKALYGVNEGATFAPSELACQFCPARGRCPALTEQRFEAAAGLFDVIVESEYTDGPGAFPETTSLSNDRLGDLLTQATGLVDLVKDLKEEAQRRLHRGDTVPGYQLVNYTPPRKWVSNAAEELRTLPGIWKDPVLVTPKQALDIWEKVVKDDPDSKKLIESLIEAPPKRPVIAKEGDRRKTWEGKPPEQMFDVEGD